MKIRISGAQPGGALIIEGLRLEVDATGCITLPESLLEHPHVLRLQAEGRLVEPETPPEMTFSELLESETPQVSAARRRRK